MAGPGGPGRDRPDLEPFHRARRVAPTADLRAFADLSIVNELDVAERDPAIAERYGDYFRGVFAGWADIASPAVIADAEKVLGYQSPARRSRHGRPSGS